MPLNPKGVISGNGNESPKTEKIDLKKLTGKFSNMPRVMTKVNAEGVDCIEHKSTKYA